MPAKYKAVKRGEPGVVGGGTQKHYASIVTNGERSIEQLTTSIERVSTVSGADIRAVLYAAVDVIPDFLSEGSIIRLGDLGSFRLSLSSKGVATEEEVTASTISDTRIIFTPGPKLRQMLSNISFQKA
ncbi:MAG: HU family DNA-binding protein [Sphingobacteriaceae bacterium]